MKFVIFRSANPYLEKPIKVSTCDNFSRVESPCGLDYKSPMASKPLIDIEMGDFRFEGDPRPFRCNQIEIEKDAPTISRCRGYYLKTH